MIGLIFFLIAVNITVFLINTSAGIITVVISLAVIVGSILKKSNKKANANSCTSGTKKNTKARLIISLVVLILVGAGIFIGVSNLNDNTIEKTTTTKKQTKSSKKKNQNGLNINPNEFYRHKIVFDQELKPGKIYIVCQIKKNQNFKIINYDKPFYLKRECLTYDSKCAGTGTWKLISPNSAYKKMAHSKEAGTLFVKATEATHLTIKFY